MELCTWDVILVVDTTKTPIKSLSMACLIFHNDYTFSFVQNDSFLGTNE